MVFDECPFCHKLFAVEEVSKEEVDSSVETTKIPVPRIGGGITRRQPLPPNPEVATSQDFVTYDVVYRCKHCGKEWTKPVEKEYNIPTRYVENEEDKTEADMDREEEQAREEEYNT